MGKIYVIGLGPGDPQLLTLGAYQRMMTPCPQFLRTVAHGAVEKFHEEGISYIAFDELYEMKETFEEVYHTIVEKLIDAAKEGDVNYYVPGDPHIAERTVALLEEREVPLHIIHGVSFVEPVLAAAGLDSVEGLLFLNGESLTYQDVDIHRHLLLTQVYDQHLLSQVKLTLSEIYGDEYPVCVVEHGGTPRENVTRLPLMELDRQIVAHHELAVVVPAMPEDRQIFDVRDLWDIMEELRGPEGCPWDREQTHRSLRPHLIEEAYELLEAIDEDHVDGIVEELGDVLLQVVFHTLIGYEEGIFYPYDVTTTLVEKLIYRHPHVFFKKKLVNSRDVGYNWDELKYGRKKIVGFANRLHAIGALPSTLVAQKMIEQSAHFGFIWDTPDGPLEKIYEELDELQQARERNDLKAMEGELGDVLFSVCSMAHMLGIVPETALAATNRKFVQRVTYMDELAAAKGWNLEDCDSNQLEMLWDLAKEKLKSSSE